MLIDGLRFALGCARDFWLERLKFGPISISPDAKRVSVADGAPELHHVFPTYFDSQNRNFDGVFPGNLQENFKGRFSGKFSKISFFRNEKNMCVFSA